MGLLGKSLSRHVVFPVPLLYGNMFRLTSFVPIVTFFVTSAAAKD